MSAQRFYSVAEAVEGGCGAGLGENREAAELKPILDS
jgi:hypothetical protein